MTVVCDACKTENRDTAMFCRGCTGKLPGFAATGPSALAAPMTLQAGKPRAKAVGASPSAIEFPRIWLGLGLLLAAMAIAFTGWYAYVTRKVAAPAVQTVATASTPSAAPSAAPVLPLTLITPVEPAQSTPPPPPVAAPPQPALQPAPAREQRRPVQTASAAPAASADPRSRCSHLNFIAAARCEAAQCDRAEYSRHPRCAAVREDRRRDEARRNPLMAN